MKIIGTVGCHKCEETKRNFPEADYYLFNDYIKDNPDFIEKLKESNIKSFPIIITDENEILGVEFV
jgi:glutaredoxin